MSRQFKVGDKVWSARKGWGVITNTNRQPGYTSYPITAEFRNGYTENYTVDGKEITTDLIPSLLFEESHISASAKANYKWRASSGFPYYFVSGRGTIVKDDELGHDMDGGRWKVGNYFRTEEEARNSKFYKVFKEDR